MVCVGGRVEWRRKIETQKKLKLIGSLFFFPLDEVPVSTVKCEKSEFFFFLPWSGVVHARTMLSAYW